MSVVDLLATLKETQQALVKALQDEYFCDDVEPPPEAFGWSEAKLRDFMESGGEIVASDAAPPSPASAPVPGPVKPVAPVLDVSDVAAGPPGRPLILCLGDANTQFGTHVINLPTADLGSTKDPRVKASLSVTTDPVATEFLRSTETDNPGVEHGPGWIALLARDYSWRSTADVVNRGYSGMNSAMLRADLPELLATVRRADVVCVTVMVGANDAVKAGEPTHVPLDAYKDNLHAIFRELREALPRASIIAFGPPPVDEAKWKETALKLTSNRKNGTERSADAAAEYNKACEAVAKAVRTPRRTRARLCAPSSRAGRPTARAGVRRLPRIGAAPPSNGCRASLEWVPLLDEPSVLRGARRRRVSTGSLTSSTG